MRSFRKSLLALAAFGAFAITSCSQKQADNANDAANNAGDAIENTADSVNADMAREPGDTAVVRDKPTDGVIEKMPEPKGQH